MLLFREALNPFLHCIIVRIKFIGPLLIQFDDQVHILFGTVVFEELVEVLLPFSFVTNPQIFAITLIFLRSFGLLDPEIILHIVISNGRSGELTFALIKPFDNLRALIEGSLNSRG